MKKYSSKSGIYSVLVPQNYMFEEEEKIAGIFDADGGSGAINISAYVIPVSYHFDMETELSDFASSCGAGSKSAEFLSKEISDEYGGCEFLVDNCGYWKCWLFYKHERAVFVSYNCEIADRLSEIDAIESIVRSIIILY